MPEAGRQQVYAGLGWQMAEPAGVSAWTAGCIGDLPALVTAAVQADWTSFHAALLRERQSFGLILITGQHIIAAADRIRSYPVFFSADQSIPLTTDTRIWLRKPAGLQLDEARAGLFLSSGYCLGSDTLSAGIRRLLAGEFMVIQRASGETRFQRYYHYCPELPELADEAGQPEAWAEQLEAGLDAAAQRVIEQANGETVWLPLSAGYDSRAVLAKLLANGCERLRTFSYGSPGNAEAKVACALADKAGVPWEFIPSLQQGTPGEYRSAETDDYFLFAGGLGSTPSMLEYFALRQLLRSGRVGHDDLMVNGQTGDFLTGGHLPASNSLAQLAEFCKNKHFSLLTSGHEGVADMQALLTAWGKDYLPSGVSFSNPDQLATAYSCFEWQERQCHYVVNQHRAHDYLGIRWALPLWDADLMDLYARVPLPLQQNQALYIDYLHRWNFRGLFDFGRLPYDPWPRYGLLYKSVARLAGLVGGEEAKQDMYRNLYYWTDLHHLYGLYGYRMYRRMLGRIRNPVSLFALDYLERLRRVLQVAPVLESEQIFHEILARTGSR